MKASILGHESDLEYSPVLAGYAIVGLRAGLGWLFFHRGVTRVLDPTWSIHSVIANVPPANPFPWACEWMGAHAAWLLDPLFSWGFVLAGACLLFGAFLGAGAILGVMLLLLTWVTSVSMEVGVVTRHIVYIVVLFALVSLGAGRIAGLDALFESHPIVENHPSLKWLLG